LINALSSTILTVFPNVYIIDIPNSFNSIIFATSKPTEVTNLYQNYRYLKDNPGTAPILLESMEVALSSLKPAPQPGEVFTDDRAPIEWITNNMVLNFLLSNEMDLSQ
jgi:hypothetical protein